MHCVTLYGASRHAARLERSVASERIGRRHNRGGLQAGKHTAKRHQREPQHEREPKSFSRHASARSLRRDRPKDAKRLAREREVAAAAIAGGARCPVRASAKHRLGGMVLDGPLPPARPCLGPRRRRSAALERRSAALHCGWGCTMRWHSRCSRRSPRSRTSAHVRA